MVYLTYYPPRGYCLASTSDNFVVYDPSNSECYFSHIDDLLTHTSHTKRWVVDETKSDEASLEALLLEDLDAGEELLASFNHISEFTQDWIDLHPEFQV